MRLTSIELTGFRAFAQTLKLDLDAETVLLIGANGTGKTSVFDGILWCLTGKVPRLGTKPVVTSAYATTGASVTIGLRDGTDSLTLTRSLSADRDHFELVDGDMRIAGADAELALLRRFWPGPASDEGSNRLLTTLTRAVYLQQDLVRDFVAADTDEARFGAVGQLVGVGQLAQLLKQLEHERNLWHRDQTRLESDLQLATMNASRLRDRLDQIASLATPHHAEVTDWAAWWRGLPAILTNQALSEPLPAFGKAEGEAALERSLLQLQATRKAVERLLARGTDLQTRVAAEAVPSSAAAALKEAVAERQALEAAINNLRKLVAEAEAAFAGERERLRKTRSDAEELAVLASIALKHLGNACPVCQQKFDREKTREHLNRLQAAASQADRLSAAQRETVDENVARLGAAQSRLRLLADNIDELRLRESAAATLQQSQEQWLLEVGGNDKSLDDGLATLRRRLDAVDRHYAQGEQLALRSASTLELGRRNEIEESLKEASDDETQLRTELGANVATYGAATKLIESTRSFSWQVVESSLVAIQTTLQRIYSRIDPHPTMTGVRLETQTTGQKGRLQILVEDPRYKLSRPAAPILSSSQLNALAVSVFLSFNLGMDAIPLRCVLLDDPLQSLDDLNLLGLIDTLRRARPERQVIISTHDRRIASLVARKLRPVETLQRSTVIEFKDWESSGPSVTQRDVMPSKKRVFRAA